MRSSSALVAVALIVCPSLALSQPRKFTVDLGAAKAEWLSPGKWATSANVDYRPLRRGRAALVVGTSAIFNQFTPGIGVTRRQHIATISLGAEYQALNGSLWPVYVHAQLAGSYWWYRYSPRRDITPAGSAFDSFGIISGLRIETPRTFRGALSIRADVRAAFDGGFTLSPRLGVGFAI